MEMQVILATDYKQNAYRHFYMRTISKMTIRVLQTFRTSQRHTQAASLTKKQNKTKNDSIKALYECMTALRCGIAAELALHSGLISITCDNSCRVSVRCRIVST